MTLINEEAVGHLDDAMKHIQNALQRIETLCSLYDIDMQDTSHFVLHLGMAMQSLIEIHPDPERWAE